MAIELQSYVDLGIHIYFFLLLFPPGRGKIRHVSNHFQWDFDGDNADGDGENGEEEDGPTVVDLGSAHDGARTAEEAPPTTESGRSFYTVFRP